MRVFQFFIILSLCCWAVDVKAQESEQMQVPEQWQLTLDVIKSKAQDLVVENNGLQIQYQQLTEQVQETQNEVDQQRYANEQASLFLKERHGHTDQQLRIEELDQLIDKKKQELRAYNAQFENLQKDQSDLEGKLGRLKDTIADEASHQQEQEEKAKQAQNTPQPLVDDQLTQLRKQLEDENRQEVLLGNQWDALKNGDKAQDLNVGAIEAENKDLEARLAVLRLQKLQHESKSSDLQLTDANERMYDKLKARRDELEANINAYESRLDDLRESSLAALSWTVKKKRLIHEMALTDARNNKMRDKIKVLREDIAVLKDQVAKLEERVDFSQGKALVQ